MSDKKTEVTNVESLQTIADDQIVTERKLPRRSFLGTTGALLAGAAGIVAGVRASNIQDSGQNDPDKKPADPDKKKSGDPDKKSADPDKKPADPDKKPADPDKKPADPDTPRHVRA